MLSPSDDAAVWRLPEDVDLAPLSPPEKKARSFRPEPRGMP
jgi:hypothetical protein